MIPDNHLNVSIRRKGPTGGMQVGMPDIIVRVEHIPSGIVVECPNRSQHKARATCLKMIETYLTDPNK